MKRMKKRKITVLAGVILCVIAGCLVKRMTAVYTQKENPIGPERGTTDVFLTAADFISEKSDQELLQEIETFDTDKAEMIYLYILCDHARGSSGGDGRNSLDHLRRKNFLPEAKTGIQHDREDFV